jgi:hypothetical protein
MKPARADRDEAFLNKIVVALKSVPKSRLRIVRDVVGALGEPVDANKNGANSVRRRRKSFLKTPFCGMWEKRREIGNGRCYARLLRERLESRGD